MWTAESVTGVIILLRDTLSGHFIRYICVIYCNFNIILRGVRVYEGQDIRNTSEYNAFQYNSGSQPRGLDPQKGRQKVK